MRFIRKFNENISDGLQELINYIKTDKDFIKIHVSGKEVANYWMLEMYIDSLTLDVAVDTQMIISKKLIDISKHYDISSSEIDLYSKGDIRVYAKIILK